MSERNSTTRGFKRTSAVLDAQIRRTGESRGFAVSRVLTHWAEIVGEDIAGIARPVEVSYGRSGFGATLTVLTTGAQAPMLEMQKEKLRAKVNAAYGYNAISRVHLTQKGRHEFVSLADEHEKWVDELLGCFDEKEVAILFRLMDKIQKEASE